jgi:hypothetical protein
MIPLEKIYALIVEYLESITENIKFSMEYAAKENTFGIKAEKGEYSVSEFYGAERIEQLFEFKILHNHPIAGHLILTGSAKNILKMIENSLYQKLADVVMRNLKCP